MSSKYKFRDYSKLHFVTFTGTMRIDLFIRNNYKNIVPAFVRDCRQHKNLEVQACGSLTSDVHLTAGTRELRKYQN